MTLVPTALVVTLTLLSLRQAFDVDVLRPVDFASRASAAVHEADRYGQAASSTFVAGDWTTQLLLTTGPTVRTVWDIPSLATRCEAVRSPRVILVLQDPGYAGGAGLQQQAVDCLRAHGFREIGHRQIAPYESLRLREKLRLSSQPSQYVVEAWADGP